MGLRGLNVTDETVESVIGQCKQLESLDISQCLRLTEATGKKIADCAALRTLKAAYCVAVITDGTLKNIGISCKLLSFLDISYCKLVTDEGLEEFSHSKRSYSGLLLNGLENLTTIGLVAVLRNSYDTLEHLEVSLLDPVLFPLT